MKKPIKRAKNAVPKRDEPAPAKVTIHKLPTGVAGLDEIVGGGIPEFSFNVIAAAPGCGKTTLAHQIVFSNATAQKPAIYFTVLGEPAIKMLRYQQKYSFFDESKVGKAVRFINLTELVLAQDLNMVLEEIIKQVTAINPAIVVVDSFRSVMRKATATTSETEMQSFIQGLTQFLTSWQTTTFLVGEYEKDEVRDNPLFIVADGIFWLSQVTERNSVVRKLQIMKLRGQDSVPGLHSNLSVMLGKQGRFAEAATAARAALALDPTYLHAKLVLPSWELGLGQREAALAADAVFMGSVGGLPGSTDNVARELRPESGLLKLRKALGVYANLRPTKVYAGLEHLSPLKPEIAGGVDILILRELLGGAYFGQPRALESDQGYNTIRLESALGAYAAWTKPMCSRSASFGDALSWTCIKRSSRTLN